MAAEQSQPSESGFTKSVQDLRQNVFERQDFDVLSHLGQGSVGLVWKTLHRPSGEIFALKVVEKSTILDKDLGAQLLKEVRTQRKMRHSNLLHCFGCFEDKECLYLVLEYAPGGDLYKLLKRRGKLNESDAAHIFAQVARGVTYLHDVCGMIHRDLKPENILLGDDLSVKVADFGWCAEAAGRSTFCGTLCMLAPEMVSGLPYDASVDLWALGVLLFEMLTGYSPFDRGGTLPETISNILSGVLRKEDIDSVPSEALPLITALLAKDAKLRLKLPKVLAHPWMQKQLKLRDICEIATGIARESQQTGSMRPWNVDKVSITADCKLPLAQNLLEVPRVQHCEDHREPPPSRGTLLSLGPGLEAIPKEARLTPTSASTSDIDPGRSSNLSGFTVDDTSRSNQLQGIEPRPSHNSFPPGEGLLAEPLQPTTSQSASTGRTLAETWPLPASTQSTAGGVALGTPSQPAMSLVSAPEGAPLAEPLSPAMSLPSTADAVPEDLLQQLSPEELLPPTTSTPSPTFGVWLAEPPPPPTSLQSCSLAAESLPPFVSSSSFEPKPLRTPLLSPADPAHLRNSLPLDAGRAEPFNQRRSLPARPSELRLQHASLPLGGIEFAPGESLLSAAKRALRQQRPPPRRLPSDAARPVADVPANLLSPSRQLHSVELGALLAEPALPTASFTSVAAGSAVVEELQPRNSLLSAGPWPRFVLPAGYEPQALHASEPVESLHAEPSPPLPHTSLPSAEASVVSAAPLPPPTSLPSASAGARSIEPRPPHTSVLSAEAGVVSAASRPPPTSLPSASAGARPVEPRPTPNSLPSAAAEPLERIMSARGPRPKAVTHHPSAPHAGGYGGEIPGRFGIPGHEFLGQIREDHAQLNLDNAEDFLGGGIRGESLEDSWFARAARFVGLDHLAGGAADEQPEVRPQRHSGPLQEEPTDLLHELRAHYADSPAISSALNRRIAEEEFLRHARSLELAALALKLRALGFSDAQAEEALKRTSSMEAAVEWIVHHGGEFA